MLEAAQELRCGKGESRGGGDGIECVGGDRGGGEGEQPAPRRGAGEAAKGVKPGGQYGQGRLLCITYVPYVCTASYGRATSESSTINTCRTYEK